MLKIIKKYLLTTAAVLTILFAQAQLSPCDSLTISGSQSQLMINANNLNTFVDSWVTTAGSTTLAVDTTTNYHSIYNYNNNTGLPYDTLTTCITVNSAGITCCVIYVWNGNIWVTLGNLVPSWDCDPVTGCYDPGTGAGVHSTLAACNAVCAVTASWDCNNGVCTDPGTGTGVHSTLAACQSNCSSGTSNYCDSIDISITNQSTIDITLSSGLSVNAIPGIVNLVWTLYSPTLITMSAINPTFSINPLNNMDSLPICLTAVIDINGNVDSCNVCDTIVWNGTSWILISMAQPTAINELNSSNRELLKVVDILGRNTNRNKNEPLFYIYNDGTVEKKIILEQ